MTLTIVIPTIGRPSLEQAVCSVYNQTIPTKLLVMYDASQQGASAARNRAASLISTDWVGFLDDDDTLDPNYSDWLCDYSSDVVIFKMLQSGVEIPREPEIRDGNVGISFAIKREVFKANPFPPATAVFIEDYLMLKQLQERGYSITFSDKVAYYVR